MNTVVDIYAPVFALGLLGYASARFGFFTRAHADGLEKFVFDFAVPLLLFRTLAQAEPLDNPPWRLLLGYYAPMALCYCIGVALCAALQRNANRKRAFAERIIGGFACSYGNAILLGLPLALLTFDADGQLAYFYFARLPFLNRVCDHHRAVGIRPRARCPDGRAMRKRIARRVGQSDYPRRLGRAGV